MLISIVTIMMKTKLRPFSVLAAMTTAAALTIAGCSASTTESVTDEHSHDHAAESDHGDGMSEAMSLEPRVVMTYDGGVMVVDTAKGEVTDDIERPGFIRISQAGDGRHLFAAEGSSFTLFDGGLMEMPHGNHAHYYTGEPKFTEVAFQADHPGHVVTHDGQTALFADGTGEVTIFDSGAIHEGEKPTNVRTFKTSAPHHGVAVPLSDGKVLVTEGTQESRKTIRLIDKDDKEIARTDECPGVHGEAVAGEGDTVTFGCEDGSIIFKDGEFHKVKAETSYQRTGNQWGSPHSAVVLTDYKIDKDAELERPTKVGLLNTDDLSFKTLDLGSSYWFRSLERGPNGEGLVLTYDGKLHIIDMDKGEELRSVDVVKPWEEKAEWQQPNAAVRVSGDIAYVIDAQAQKLHMVDIEEGKIMSTVDLPHVANEIAIVTGKIPHGVKVAEMEGEDHDGHHHEGDGHDHDHDHGEPSSSSSHS